MLTPPGFVPRPLEFTSCSQPNRTSPSKRVCRRGSKGVRQDGSSTGAERVFAAPQKGAMDGKSARPDHHVKLLLVGESGVGKSSLLMCYIDEECEDLSPTIGVDFKLKTVLAKGKCLRLAVWDTAGQEKFRTLTSSFYRDTHGIIFVFDVTRRETFQNLEEVWVKEVDTYTTIDKSVRMVIGNKIDKEQERVVTHAEGMAFANEHNCIYFEASAKQREGVQQAYSELIDQIVEMPGLLGPSQNGQILRMHTPTENQGGSSSCSC